MHENGWQAQCVCHQVIYNAVNSEFLYFLITLKWPKGVYVHPISCTWIIWKVLDHYTFIRSMKSNFHRLRTYAVWKTDLSDITDLRSASQTCRTFQSKTTLKREKFLNDCADYLKLIASEKELDKRVSLLQRSCRQWATLFTTTWSVAYFSQHFLSH